MLFQTLSGKWQFRQTQTEEWLPAQVPGGVHTDLLALERIPDPFVGDNEKKVMWVAEQDWEYRKTFTVDAGLLAEEKVFLVCDGLDTLAEVRLNGQRLGQAENLFRRYEWEIKAHLQPDQNELHLVFPSTVRYCAQRQAEHPLMSVDQALTGGHTPAKPHAILVGTGAPCSRPLASGGTSGWKGAAPPGWMTFTCAVQVR